MELLQKQAERVVNAKDVVFAGNQQDVLKGILDELYELHCTDKRGILSSTSPELTNADANKFGLSAVTLSGDIDQTGDSAFSFTAQSIAKILILALALEERDAEIILDKIGVEPTGKRFDALLRTEDMDSIKLNPFINAGALAALELIPADECEQRFDKYVRLLERIIQRNIQIDENALALRREKDHRNHALAYLLLSRGVINEPVEPLLDVYQRICCTLLNCNDLALIAAVLANGGIHPRTNTQLISAANVKFILSTMQSCGMYEFSGQWAYRVGLPAKSGLCGAILMVVPEQFGFAVYSPRLDETNQKSVRGLRVCEQLSRMLDLHIFRKSSAVLNGTNSKAPGTASLQSDMQGLLGKVYIQSRNSQEGDIYNSVPNIVQVNPDAFAITITTVDGECFEVGDADTTFLLQSISKVFTYGLALEDHGRDVLLQTVGVEPTGNPYDAIIRLDQKTKRAHNPMINTGAIATTALIQGDGLTDRLNRILNMYQRYVGHEVFVELRTYLSEVESGDRNKAIAYLLRHFDMLEGNVDDAFRLYLQQCSAMINCRDLSMMAATLANGGIHPLTQVRAVDANYIEDILTVMYTCGMYNYSGEWSYRIGLPAKSGVSGAIMAVVPGQMGIAIYSPRIDQHGNSIAGIHALEMLSFELNLSMFS